MPAIGYDAKRLFHNKTGLGNYSRTLVSNMAKYYPDHAYSLYASKIDTSQWKDSFSNNIFNINNYLGPTPSYWRSYGMTNELNTADIDIYHGLSNELPFNIKKSKTKGIVTIHDMIYHKRPEDFPWIDRNFYHLKTKKACQQAEKIIAISHQTKTDIVDILGVSETKIDVVYQSCQSNFYNVMPAKVINKTKNEFRLPDQYILSVGTLQPRKNLDLLIDAYSTLPTDCQIPVVIVGKGKLEQTLRQKVHKLRLSSKFIWLNNIESTEHLQSIYQLATLLVYPSHYEGFGLPVVEASLSGLASITSSSSSLPEAAGPYSTLINKDNKAELAHALERLLKDDDIRLTSARKSKEYALSKFSPSQTTSKLMKTYESIL